MTLDEYRDWLDAQIRVVGPIMEQLMNARKTLELAERELGRGIPLDLPERRPPPPAPTPKKKYVYPVRPFKTGMMKGASDKVLAILAKGPMTSGEVIDAFYDHMPLKKEKDRVYVVLSNLKAVGQLERDDETMRWSIIAAIPKEQANG